MMFMSASGLGRGFVAPEYCPTAGACLVFFAAACSSRGMGHVRTTAHALARHGEAACGALLALSLFACGSPEPPKAPEPVVEEAPAEPPSTLPLAPVPPILLRDVGFRSPESVLYDPVADVYLVSNV